MDKEKTIYLLSLLIECELGGQFSWSSIYRDRNGLGQGQRSLRIGAGRLFWTRRDPPHRKNRAVSQKAGNSTLRINGGHDAGRLTPN